MDDHNPTSPVSTDHDDDYERAAEWLDVMADGDMDELSQRRFSLWFNNGSAERRAIFERLSQTWNDTALERAAADYRVNKPSLLKTTKAAAGSVFTAPRIALAAALMTGVIISSAYFSSVVKPANGNVASELQTPIQQSKNYQLADGSAIEMSPQCDLSINFTRAKRDLALKQGAAYFQVAHDKSRPFDVHIGNVSVLAVGTAFNIDRYGEVVDIVVHEGVVEVRSTPDATPQRLAAGSRAHIVNQQMTISQVDLASWLDWRSGWIELTDSHLDAVVEHLNRYSATPIQLLDADLKKIPVAGRFQLQNPTATLAMLTELYHLDVQKTEQQVLLRKRSGRL